MELSNKYFGGKNRDGVYQRIINLIPDTKVFIELFAGSAPFTRRAYREDVKYILVEKDELQHKKLLRYFSSKKNVTVIKTCVLEYLKKLKYQPWYNTSVVLYLDPPYPHSCRKNPKGCKYKHELTDDQHFELIQIVQDLACKIILSSYHNKIYSRQLSYWNKKEIKTNDRALRTRWEVAWYNFPLPDKLLTYEYLGEDYRERYRIKGIISRNISKIKRMPAAEQNAYLHALYNEFFKPKGSIQIN